MSLSPLLSDPLRLLRKCSGLHSKQKAARESLRECTQVADAQPYSVSFKFIPFCSLRTEHDTMAPVSALVIPAGLYLFKRDLSVNHTQAVCHSRSDFCTGGDLRQ